MKQQIEKHEDSRHSLMRLMLSTLSKTDFFAADQNDEFKVVLPTGDALGIFKTWAFPIIPLLEQLNIQDAQEVVSSLKKGGHTQLTALERDWHTTLLEKPNLYAQTLERWRTFSERWDRRLQQVFLEREIPSDPKKKFVELLLRLKIAFAMATAFYNIEALIVDPRENLLSTKQSENVNGGALDLVGMMLPAALKEHVDASMLEWNGLSWNIIAQAAASLSDDDLALVCQIASLAEVGIQDIIFAANVLEWIPSNVGGKKDDNNSSDARKTLLNLLSKEQKSSSHGLVAKNMNALIRFHNWVPILKTSDNFTTGSSWQYAAVCDTANQIFEIMEKEDNILQPEFASIFKAELLPQLKNLDATSARGRFVLQVVDEHKVQLDVIEDILDREKKFFLEISNSLDKMEQQEAVVDLFETHPRALVGGKAFGIREAAVILGKEKVVSGIVVTSEAVENLLLELGVWDTLIEMDKLTDIDKIMQLADQVTFRLNSLEIPRNIVDSIIQRFGNSSLVVRSSSQDEDTLTSTAAGIYESETQVTLKNLTRAFQKVLSSFFSEKAVSYRCLNGLSHKPMFAVLIQEYIPGRGGVIFTKGNGKDFHLDLGVSPQHVVRGDTGTTAIDSQTLTGDLSQIDTQVREVIEDAFKVEKMMGRGVDMEFAITHQGVRFLQKRNLPAVKNEIAETVEQVPSVEVKIDQLSDLTDLEFPNGTKAQLTLSSAIDTEQFQGSLFRWLVKHKSFVKEIKLPRPIAMTSHFANICQQLGIKISF